MNKERKNERLRGAPEPSVRRALGTEGKWLVGKLKVAVTLNITFARVSVGSVGEGEGVCRRGWRNDEPPEILPSLPAAADSDK